MLPVSNTLLVSWNTHDISTSIGYYAIIRITSFLKRPKKSSSAAKFCLKSFVSLRAVLSCHDVLQQPNRALRDRSLCFHHYPQESCLGRSLISTILFNKQQMVGLLYAESQLEGSLVHKGNWCEGPERGCVPEKDRDTVGGTTALLGATQ